MKITPKTDQYLVTYHNGEYLIDFGDIKKNTHTQIELNINADNITNFKITPHCGCTAANGVVVDKNNVTVIIGYRDVHIVKPFTKTATLELKENGAKRSQTIRIKGKIIG